MIKGQTPHVVVKIAILACAALLCSACSEDHDVHNHPELTTGEDLFNFHCAVCHGTDGTGRLADRKPANILTRLSLSGIVKYITTPVNPDRNMPVFSAMPEAEAVAIANHVFKLRRIYLRTPLNIRKPTELLIEP